MKENILKMKDIEQYMPRAACNDEKLMCNYLDIGFKETNGFFETI